MTFHPITTLPTAGMPPNQFSGKKEKRHILPNHPKPTLTTDVYQKSKK
jgi:hypothetical protein